MKDAFYFPHYSNARNDRKIKRLMKSLGVEGYGIYFMLLEVLREQTEFRYPISDIDLLADEFGTSTAKVEAVIRVYDLFHVDDDEMFFSINLIKYLEPMFKHRDQRSKAGKASAESRRIKLLEKSTTAERPLNDSLTDDERAFNENEQSKGEESKGKESKGKEITYAPDFENAWEQYGRKGSKKAAYTEWNSLSQQDRSIALSHIPRYVEANESEPHFMKDFERYLKHGTFHSTIIERPRKNTFNGAL
jgi:uncharacterized protein YdaU (DUF1376 family)